MMNGQPVEPQKITKVAIPMIERRIWLVQGSGSILSEVVRAEQ